MSFALRLFNASATERRLQGEGVDPGPGSFVPGVLVVGLLALTVHAIHGALPSEVGRVAGEVILGMGAGVLVRNFVGLRPAFECGVRFCFDKLLKVAIVLLGVKISITTVIETGGSVLVLIIAMMGLALAVTHFLAKRMGVAPKLATLIGCGTAICGNTAISAIAPAIGAKDEEMSFAIATNTLFGTAAVFAYPFIGHALGLSDGFFGIWSGVAINDTSQVLAAGTAYGDVAGDVAITVKLTRNALLGFVVLGATMSYAASSCTEGDRKIGWSSLRLPAFIVFFLIMAALNSAGVFNAIAEAGYSALFDDLKALTKWLILMALVAVGLSTRFTSMRKIGWRPLVIGLAAAAVSAVLSFFAIRVFGLG